jgi:hypothetical protein
MCKPSLLPDVGAFSTFHVEKPIALLSFSNEEERRNKRKNDSRTKKNKLE